MRILSIDPGKNGALVLLDLCNLTMRTEKVPLIKNKGAKPEIDKNMLYKHTTDMLANADFLVIEDVHSMPRDGVVSAFSFGYFNGFIDGCLQGARWRANDPRVYRTPPQVWKAALGLLRDKSLPQNRQVKEAKERAIRLAHAMYPQCVDILDTEGKCEATLIGFHWLMTDGHLHARLPLVEGVEGGGLKIDKKLGTKVKPLP